MKLYRLSAVNQFTVTIWKKVSPIFISIFIAMFKLQVIVSDTVKAVHN